MKTYKIILLIIIFTFLALLHVFFHSEAIKLGYELKRHEDALQRLIDNNNVLKYNIYALESPSVLNRNIALHDLDLKTLRSYQVLCVYPQSKIKIAKRHKFFWFKNPVFLMLRKFLGSSQAEAKTIK